MAASAQIVVMLLKFCVIAAAAGCRRKGGVAGCNCWQCVCEKFRGREFIDI